MTPSLHEVFRGKACLGQGAVPVPAVPPSQGGLEVGRADLVMKPLPLTTPNPSGALYSHVQACVRVVGAIARPHIDVPSFLCSARLFLVNRDEVSHNSG